MACWLGQSPVVVRLWMAGHAYCKQVPVQRWSRFRGGSSSSSCHMRLSLLPENVGCWRLQMHAGALEKLVHSLTASRQESFRSSTKTITAISTSF